MASIIPGFEYDIFISYRHKDNKYDGWVNDFVANLKRELEATFKEEVSLYFDENTHDGLLEIHNVDKSLEGKLKCLVFIPIISQTYCDPKSFAWQHEFLAFNQRAKEDAFGIDIRLPNGNVCSRILPVRIHDLDAKDKALLEAELKGVLRPVDFIYKSAGVNRPLRNSEDNPSSNLTKTFYRDQINKVANAIKETLLAMSEPIPSEKPVRTLKAFNFQSQKKRKIRVIAYILLALLLPVCYLGFLYFTQTKTELRDKSIAVLPFVDLSKDHDQEYFSDGMMEEILNHLSKISELKVISRTTSMKYRGSKQSLNEIASELGVSNILSGSVRTSGGKVRITVQLIDAKTDKQLWSQDYDYQDFKDILAVQSDASTKVATILRLKLSEQEQGSLGKQNTENQLAYNFYRKGRSFWDKRSYANYDSAELNYKRAIELDPEYALAYAGLADLYTFNQKGLSQLEALPIAKAYVEKALALDSSLCEAWTTKGFIQSHIEFDWKGSIKFFDKALRLNPNYPIAHLYKGNVYFAYGDTARGNAETRKALSLDPLSSSINWVVGRNYLIGRQYQMSIKQGRKTLALDQRYIYARIFLALALIGTKSYDEAISILNALPDLTYGTGENKHVMLSYAYASSGNTVKARVELDFALKRKENLSPFYLGMTYVALGDNDKALDQFEQGYENRVIQMLFMKNNPWTDPIRDDPRFKAILKKMNFTD